MLDLSLAELLLIVVVAVVFIGPKELPTVLRAVSKAMRAMRAFSMEVRKNFDQLAEESGVTPEIKMIQGDDGNWYESYPLSSPSRSEAGRGASVPSPDISGQESPHPTPLPKGEGV